MLQRLLRWAWGAARLAAGASQGEGRGQVPGRRVFRENGTDLKVLLLAVNSLGIGHDGRRVKQPSLLLPAADSRRMQMGSRDHRLFAKPRKWPKWLKHSFFENRYFRSSKNAGETRTAHLRSRVVLKSGHANDSANSTAEVRSLARLVISFSQ